MREIIAAAALLIATFPHTQAFHKGFNIASQRPDGSCKVQADWEHNFNVMKSLPGNFKDVRLFASSDCDALGQAVPAALNTGIQILVGIWTEDANHYNAEKQALLRAVARYGVSWISAISVGSEDLYRGDTDPYTLAQQIYDVRGMMSVSGGKGIWVGHTDTWNLWSNDTAGPVIAACDFVGMNAYSYFQYKQPNSIDDALALFDADIAATANAIAKYRPGTHIWLTETGWPAAGPTTGLAVASVANAERWWQEGWCTRWSSYASYVYTLRDYNQAPANPSFGVVDVNFNPIYNLACNNA